MSAGYPTAPSSITSRMARRLSLGTARGSVGGSGVRLVACARNPRNEAVVAGPIRDSFRNTP